MVNVTVHAESSLISYLLTYTKFASPPKETNDSECLILFEKTMQAPPRPSGSPGHNQYQSNHTLMYSNIGSPTAEISGIVHFKSNAFDRTILNICNVSAEAMFGGKTF